MGGLHSVHLKKSVVLFATPADAGVKSGRIAPRLMESDGRLGERGTGWRLPSADDESGA